VRPVAMPACVALGALAQAGLNLKVFTCSGERRPKSERSGTDQRKSSRLCAREIRYLRELVGMTSARSPVLSRNRDERARSAWLTESFITPRSLPSEATTTGSRPSRLRPRRRGSH
jgi:hypothetical protein